LRIDRRDPTMDRGFERTAFRIGGRRPRTREQAADQKSRQQGDAPECFVHTSSNAPIAPRVSRRRKGPHRCQCGPARDNRTPSVRLLYRLHRRFRIDESEPVELAVAVPDDVEEFTAEREAAFERAEESRATRDELAR